MNEVIPRRARKLHVVEHRPELLDDKFFIEEMRANIRDRDFYVIKNLVDAKILTRIREHLTNLGRGSLPSWAPLEEGCSDFHRIQRMNPRSPVQGVLHQFMFHPWNEHPFDLFDLFAPVYRYRNLISGFDPDRPRDDTTAAPYHQRLLFQYYPRGGGMMNRHSDPVGEHQLTIPAVQLSRKGIDYEQGGLVVLGEDDQPIDVDEHLEIGDGGFFNAEVVHGVDPVDPDAPLDWYSYEGRWVCIVAVVRSTTNRSASSALTIDY